MKESLVRFEKTSFKPGDLFWAIVPEKKQNALGRWYCTQKQVVKCLRCISIKIDFDEIILCGIAVEDETMLTYEVSEKDCFTSEEEAKQENEPDKAPDKSKLPKPGEIFSYNGHSFIALGMEQGGLLAIAAEQLAEEMAFDEDDSNDWRSSSLRKYLNGEYLDELGKDYLLPFTSDLTADDGMKDYGTSEDYVFLLSDNLYRKYRPFVPSYKAWWWTITPYSCLPSNASYERLVTTGGGLCNYTAINASAVAPACLLNLKFF